MLIGIDFDNTIVYYDQIFHKVAIEKRLIPEDLPPFKREIRDYLRQQDQEDLWTALQGYVYGVRLIQAPPCPGILEFLIWCKDQGISVSVISHRTRRPFMGPQCDLHKAAKEWIKRQGFYERTGLSPEHVHFELTKEEKLDRIRQESCDLFIDDLPEFLAEPGFPERVKCILFDANNLYPTEDRFERATSWKEITQLIKYCREFQLGDTGNKNTVGSLLAQVGLDGKFEMHPLDGGANNRVFRIDVNGSKVCLKYYFEHPDDPRDRMEAEFRFVCFAWNQGIRSLPQPLACDPRNGIALYEFIPGRLLKPGEITSARVKQALCFYRDLNHNKKEVEADGLPRASESCFSIAEHVEKVNRSEQRRFAHLAFDQEAQKVKQLQKARHALQTLTHFSTHPTEP